VASAAQRRRGDIVSVGYSGTPLLKKLGIGEATHLTVITPPAEYEAILGPIPVDARIGRRLTRGTNLVHVFVTRKDDLSAHLRNLRARLPGDVAVWVSWPKKSAKVPTTVTEDVVRELALPLGYVDVKVCAVSEVWSGLKLVVRKELRTQRGPEAPLDTSPEPVRTTAKSRVAVMRARHRPKARSR
jgi:hypothetical protein